MKLVYAAALVLMLVAPTPARAEPVSAFFNALLALVPKSVVVFFSSTLGSVLLQVGFSALSIWISRSNTPSPEAARVNTRLVDAVRWQLAGTAISGGDVGAFAEYDADGNFWFFVLHGDAEMTGDPQYFLDNIPVTLAETAAVEKSVDWVLGTENYDLDGEVVVNELLGTVTSNDRVLVRNQDDASENGIWVTSSGAWTRAADMAAGSAIDYFVVGGTPLGGGPDVYYSVTDPSGLVGTADMIWSVGRNERAIGDVLTDAFCLTNGYKQYEGAGVRLPWFRLYPVTPTASQVYGDRPAEFAAAFPDLPADFLLAGVSYTIVRCKAIPVEHYGNAFRWRGLMGLGEPGVALVSNWNRMYDPRNGAHDINDPSTWTPGDGNPVITWAWWRTNRYGRNRPMTAINWTKVAEQADICDQTVLDRSGVSIPRYRGAFAFPDNKPRHECEREILDTFDGFVVYDDDGKAWPRAGIYEAPTLTFSAARDILSEQTQTVDDGEAQIDGVIVEYISPDHGYTKQPAAPWRNPNFYNPLITPNYRRIMVLGCQNHNQAVRLAKAYGLVFGPARKAALGTTIKGVLAKGERTIDLDLDDEFQGDYQIITPVIEGANGLETTFAVVPMQTDRYDMNEGEEGAPPAIPEPLDIDNTLEVAQNVTLSVVSVLTAAGEAARLEATFDAPERVDREFRFRYAPTGTTSYEYFATDMDELRAISAIVDAGAQFDVQWQTITAAGRATDWSAITIITATITPIDIDDLQDPGQNGISRSVSGLPDGIQLVIGDGEWWRRVSSGTIVTAARYVALFDYAEYQADRVPGALAGVLSLTRASAATYVGEDGLIASAAIDAPRFDYLLGTRALLVEPSATNLCLRSEALNDAAWTPTGGATITADATTAPTGFASGDRINVTGSGQGAYQAVTFGSGAAVVISIFVKANTGTTHILLRDDLSAGRHIRVNLADGTVTATAGTITDYGTEDYGNGWFRVWMAYTTGTGSARLLVRSDNAAAGSFYAWGGQIEAGTKLTTYIQTFGSSVTRSADVPTMQGVTATLDLSVRYGDGSNATLAAQSVSPGFWPTLASTRIRRIVGRE